MESNFDILKYWSATVYQSPLQMRGFFDENAKIVWHNTNEIFTVDRYIELNCKYPKKWDFEIHRKEIISDLIITAVKVFAVDNGESHYVVSFIRLKNNKVISLDEYWGENSEIPQWRRDI